MRAPGFYTDIPEVEYHADRETLSVSGAKLLLKAPALYRHQLDNPVYRDAFDIGSAAHSLVLGVGAELEVIDADSWRTKAAAEARDRARAEGKTPLLAADHARVLAMADKLSEHTLAMRLLSDGKPEVSAYAIDEPTAVMRRARFDWLGDNVLVDYKTCASADPKDWSGRYGVIRKFGYDLQAAWYLDIARDLGHPASAWAWIAQEKVEPYLVTVIEVDEYELEEARDRNRLALEMFRDCMESGLWPGYVGTDAAVRVSLRSQEWDGQVIA